MNKKVTSLLNILLILLIPVALCYASKKEFKTDYGFSLYLSNEWTELPKNILEQHNMGQTSKWDFGYIMSNEDNTTKYRPNILVKINESGRIPASEFDKYRKSPKDINKELNKNKGQTDPGNISILEYFFDDKNYTLNISSKIKLQNIGNILSHGITVFTEKGYIEIAAYTIESESDIYTPFFKEALKSINIDNSLRYEKRISDAISTNAYNELRHIINYIIGASIGIFGYMLFKRKKDNAKKALANPYMAPVGQEQKETVNENL